MSLRKRMWTTPRGTEKSAWVVEYADRQGTRGESVRHVAGLEPVLVRGSS